MDKRAKLPFLTALDRYQRAKAGIKLCMLDQSVANIDFALDELMAEPSPSLGAFGEKMRILEKEYGLNAQPRHIGAIYADVALLVAVAGTIAQAWPGS